MPTDLRVSFGRLDRQVIVSWSYSSDNVPGFLVERALDSEGPWSIVRFTRERSIVDFLSDDLSHCYRVSAGSGSPSGPLCIQVPTL